MPNHIQNKLQVISDNEEVQKVLNHIKGKGSDGKEIQIDFNKIKQMPKGMDVEVHMGIKMWVEICTGQINFDSLFKPLEKSVTELFSEGRYGVLSERMAASKAMEHLTGKREGNVKDFSKKDFNLFIKCLRNFREYGSTSWYEWAIANWGTKWNAYSQGDKRNTEDTIYFQTAWSSPLELIRKLSELFPLVKIELTYADEDSGNNTGKIIFEKGEAIDIIQPESQSIEGYDIYFELNPESKSEFKLVNGKYEYIEEE